MEETSGKIDVYTFKLLRKFSDAQDYIQFPLKKKKKKQ